MGNKTKDLDELGGRPITEVIMLDIMIREIWNNIAYSLTILRQTGLGCLSCVARIFGRLGILGQSVVWSEIS